MCKKSDNKDSRQLDRRSALSKLSVAAACAAFPSWKTVDAADRARISGMGLVIYDCNIRRKWLRQHDPANDLFEPFTFLQHCESLGAGGMQANLGVMTADKVRELREFADQHDAFIDAIIRPPKEQGRPFTIRGGNQNGPRRWCASGSNNHHSRPAIRAIPNAGRVS